MKLVFSAEARSNLRKIGDEIARDNPVRAISFVEELEARCRALPAMPLAYPLASRNKSRGIRRLVHGNYLVFYRVERESVVILHVLAGRLNIDALLRLSDE